MRRKEKVNVNFVLEGAELQRIYDFCEKGIAKTPSDFVKKALTYYLVELSKIESLTKNE